MYESSGQKKIALIKDFKEVTQNVYDFANRWGTGKVFLKRKVMLK